MEPYWVEVFPFIELTMDQYIQRFNKKKLYTFICDGVCPTFTGSFSTMEVTSFNICDHSGIWIEKPKLK